MRRGRHGRALSRLAAGVAVLLAAGAAPAGGAGTPYVVTIDVSAEVRALGSDDPFVSEPAVEHLVALGPPALPALARAYREEPAAIRAGVVDVARQIDDPAAATLLMAAAGDPDATVRAAALVAIGLGREAGGAAVVEAALGDSDRRARRAAILACGQVCTSPAAFDRLATAALGDEESAAARQSLQSAVADADPTRVAAARAAITARALPALADPDPARRLAAALTAALIGEPGAVPILAHVLRMPPSAIAPQAALALGGVPTPEAVAALVTAARGSDAGVANAACVSLQRLRQASVPGADDAVAACRPSATPAARSSS